MKVHWDKNCRGVRTSFWSRTFTKDYTKVTCSYCKVTARLERPIYLVSKNGFLNVVDRKPLPGETLLLTTTLNKGLA